MMRTLISLFLALVLTHSVAGQDSLGLAVPPLDSLIAWAVAHAPEMKVQSLNIEMWEQEKHLRKLDWTDKITASVGGFGGNMQMVTNSYLADIAESQQAETARTDFNYNAGLTLRFSLGDVMKAKEQQQLGQIRIEKAEAERNMVAWEVSTRVAEVYDNLMMVLATIKTRSDYMEAYRMAASIAEQQYRNGTLPESDYAMALARKASAEEEYERTKYLAKFQLHQLELLVGRKIQSK